MELQFSSQLQLPEVAPYWHPGNNMSTFKTAILLLLISASLISADVEEEKEKSEDVDVERLEDAKERNILEGLENGKIEGVEDKELSPDK